MAFFSSFERHRRRARSEANETKEVSRESTASLGSRPPLSPPPPPIPPSFRASIPRMQNYDLIKQETFWTNDLRLVTWLAHFNCKSTALVFSSGSPWKASDTSEFRMWVARLIVLIAFKTRVKIFYKSNDDSECSFSAVVPLDDDGKKVWIYLLLAYSKRRWTDVILKNYK